jgi:hypothetical protein
MRPTAALLSLLLVAWTPLPKSLSPEIHLAAPGIAPHATWTFAVDVASDGTGFFASSAEYLLQHLGMAFDERGDHALERSIRITDRSGARTAVASSGRNYLVVWDDYTAIRAARFTAGGIRIDREPLVLRTYKSSATVIPPPGAEVDVAWNGSHYVVVSELTPGEAVVTLVGDDGRVVQNGIVVSGNRIATREGVSVIVNHREWQPGELVAQAITSGGVVRRSTLGSAVTQAAVAAGAEGFYVVYRVGPRLHGRQLDAHGEPAGEEELIADDAEEPAVAWNGTHWAIAYVTRGGDDALWVVRKHIDRSPVKVSEKYVEKPALASNGTRAMLTWIGISHGPISNPRSPQAHADLPPEVPGLRKVMIDANGVSDTAPLHRIPAPVNAPVMAAAGGNTLVAWTESNGRFPGGSVRVQPVHDGVPLPAQTHELPELSWLTDFVSNGSEALLMTSNQSPRSMRFLRIGADGRLLSETALDGYYAWDTARGAWTGTHYLVVWRQVAGNAGSEYLAVRIGADGKLLDAQPVKLASGGIYDGGTAEVAVRGDGTALAAWPLHQSNAIHGRLISPAMQITAMESIATSARINDIELATDGERFLLTHIDETPRLAWSVLEGSSVIATGHTPVAFDLHARNFETKTFWNGEYYLAVRVRANRDSEEPVIEGMRIAPGGDRIDPSTQFLTNFAPNRPTLYSGAAMMLGANHSLELAYLQIRDASSLGSSVVYRRLTPPKRRGVR